MTDAGGAQYAVPVTLRPLPGLDAALLIQGSTTDVDLIADASGVHGLGAVYTLDGRSTPRTATDAIGSHRRRAGAHSAVLLDAGHYVGSGLKPISEGVSVDWLQAQDVWGLPIVMADTGFAEVGDIAGIRAVLQATSRTVYAKRNRLIVPLPLDEDVIIHHADLVRAAVEDAGVPVMYMIGAPGDPLGSKNAVIGLRHLLASDVPSALGRTDLAGIGAMSIGAAFTAIGLRPALRHIYPPSDFRRRSTDDFPLYLPMGLSFHRREKIALAVSRLPDSDYWVCWCEYCMGRSLDNIDFKAEAQRHAIRAHVELACHVLNGSTAVEARQVWIALCHQAQFVHLEICDQLGKTWKMPSLFAAWVATDSPDRHGNALV